MEADASKHKRAPLISGGENAYHAYASIRDMLYKNMPTINCMRSVFSEVSVNARRPQRLNMDFLDDDFEVAARPKRPQLSNLFNVSWDTVEGRAAHLERLHAMLNAASSSGPWAKLCDEVLQKMCNTMSI